MSKKEFWFRLSFYIFFGLIIPFVFLVFVVGLLFFFYRYKIFSLVYAWVAIYFSLIFSMVVLFLSTKTERVGFWVIMRNLSLIWLISMFLE